VDRRTSTKGRNVSVYDSCQLMCQGSVLPFSVSVKSAEFEFRPTRWIESFENIHQDRARFPSQ